MTDKEVLAVCALCDMIDKRHGCYDRKSMSSMITCVNCCARHYCINSKSELESCHAVLKSWFRMTTRE